MHDEHSTLTALSPLDGRYRAKVAGLADYFSEFALIRQRIRIELAWLAALGDEPGIPEVPAFPPAAKAEMDAAIAGFSVADAARVKEIERTTNHDVKAVEYWLKERFARHADLMPVLEFIHFACTSEDINNLAHGLALHDARNEVLLPALHEISGSLRAMAH